jgi:hypothetical protein
MGAGDCGHCCGPRPPEVTGVRRAATFFCSSWAGQRFAPYSAAYRGAQSRDLWLDGGPLRLPGRVGGTLRQTGRQSDRIMLWQGLHFVSHQGNDQPSSALFKHRMARPSESAAP